MRRTTAALPVMLLAAALLGGCGFFSRHLDRQDDTYRQSAQSRPLEVPPDLDSPASNAALTIPDARPAAATSSPVADAGTPPGISAAPAPGAAPPAAAAAPGVVPTGDGLLVSDSLESTYRRVGLALERSGAARVLGSDAAAHSYEVETTGQTTIKPGWFKRAVMLGRAGNKVTSQVRLGVTVEESAQGSRVRVGGGGDEASREAAQALLQVLRERLS
ncbi:MAG: hypothetical protein EOP90_08180 [Lysobacteraceae bacterium]|nr:MAG: hypothetical protein EOP90_08180 [Xanthomonadaceae bacterium]